MKRKIKFRAWIPNTGWLADGFSIAMDGTEWYDDNGHSWQLSQLELMQFTGLKDKNGKEIYEGDILNKKTTFQNNMADRRFQPSTEIEVSFQNGCFVDKNTTVTLYEKMATISSFRITTWTHYEVIGNIYENKNLLNEYV